MSLVPVSLVKIIRTWYIPNRAVIPTHPVEQILFLPAFLYLSLHLKQDTLNFFLFRYKGASHDDQYLLA